MESAECTDAERRKILAAIAKKAYEEGLYGKACIPDDGDDE